MATPRGSVLAVSYLFTAILALWLGTTFVRSTTESTGSNRYSDTTQAFQLAEAAVDRALIQLRASGSTSPIASSAMGDGTYSATITANPSQAGTYTIVGTGVQDTIQQRVEVVVQMASASTYRWGMFGVEEVDVTGSIVADSYNSSQGSYAQTRRANGDIGTNGTAHASIDVNGSALINGDLIVGPGADVNTAIRISGSQVISGTPQAATEAAVLPAPTTDATCAGELRLQANETLTLAAGTYRYESIRASAGSQLVTTGDVTIYVSEGVDFSGTAMVGADGVPGALTIKVLGTEDVTVSGSATLKAVIYAPNADVRLTGGATVYGAIVGRRVAINGSAVIHYDEALSSGAQSQNYQLTIRSWRTL